MTNSFNATAMPQVRFTLRRLLLLMALFGLLLTSITHIGPAHEWGMLGVVGLCASFGGIVGAMKGRAIQGALWGLFGCALGAAPWMIPVIY